MTWHMQVIILSHVGVWGDISLSGNSFGTGVCLLSNLTSMKSLFIGSLVLLVYESKK